MALALIAGYAGSRLEAGYTRTQVAHIKLATDRANDANKTQQHEIAQRQAKAKEAEQVIQTANLQHAQPTTELRNKLAALQAALRNGHGVPAIGTNTVETVETVANLVSHARETGQLEYPINRIAMLDPPITSERGTENITEKLKLQRPVGTMIVSLHPKLNWSPVAGAESYSVTVVDAANGTEVGGVENLKLPTWVVRPALARGRSYEWEVTAKLNGGTVHSRIGEFCGIGETELRDMDSMLPTAGASAFSRGVVYAHFGLLDEANDELQKASLVEPAASKLLKFLRYNRNH